MSLEDRCRKIRLLLLDVDGVLTDGRLLYGPEGDWGRTFHVRDGMGLKLAQSAGLLTGILSGRRVEATALRAEELGFDEIHQGHPVKLPVLEDILARQELALEQVAYMGDDVIDLPLLRRVGLAAAPSDACPEVAAIAHWHSVRDGGDGCVRDLIETILRAQGAWQGLIERMGEPAPDAG
ncbi:MAG: hypothetical protein AAF533_27130 [Acidobacteriota bacterium]